MNDRNGDRSRTNSGNSAHTLNGVSLDSLFEGDKLIPEILYPENPELKYVNPKRSKEVFYKFVEAYAIQLGIDVVIERLGFVEIIREKIRREGASYFMGKFLFDIPYPIIGGNFGETIIRGERQNEAMIKVPDYHGLAEIFNSDWQLLGSDRLHEYMHLYHHLLLRDLSECHMSSMTGLLQSKKREQINDIFMWRAPTYKRMKKLERAVIDEITHHQ